MSDKHQQHFGQRDGVEQTRDLSPDEKAIRKLARELGITPAAAAGLIRVADVDVNKQTNRGGS